MTKSDPFLRIEALAVGYNRIPVLEDVTFSACPGDVIGIIGGNGSGKSTLLKTIAGVVPPISGNIFIQNTSMAGKSTFHRVREFKLSYLLQHNRQISNLTVDENLHLAQWATSSRIDREKNIQSVLSERPFDQLKSVLREYANVLSGGQSLLLALATVALQDGNLILLDEPSDGLDERNRSLVVELIKGLKSQYRVILVVEQLLRIVFTVANRVYVIAPLNTDATVRDTPRASAATFRELRPDTVSRIRDVYAQNRILLPAHAELIESLIWNG